MTEEELEKLSDDWEAEDVEGYRDAWQFRAGYRSAESRLLDQNLRLLKRIEALKAALEFYALADNWQRCRYPAPSAIMLDVASEYECPGNRARQALKIDEESV